MNFEQKKLDRYCSEMSSPPSDILKELERETHLTTLAPQMLTGHVQGLFLKFVSQMIQPKCVLEIGTFTGYSAICLAEGLQEKGTLHTIEINKERIPIIEKYLKKAGLEKKVKVHLGDANEVLPNLNIVIDLAFIDAAKFDYTKYFNLLIDKVRTGGIIVVDNVLWSGKVLTDADDPDTRELKIFNAFIKKDFRVENVILPIRDGINLIRKL